MILWGPGRNLRGALSTTYLPLSTTLVSLAYRCRHTTPHKNPPNCAILSIRIYWYNGYHREHLSE